MCSSNLSVNCEYVAKQTLWQPDCRSPLSKRSHVGNLRQTNKQKEVGVKRVETLVSTLLPRRGRGSLPLNLSENLSARQGRTRLRQFVYPVQSVQKKVTTGKGEHACAVRVPQTAAACYPIRCSILSAVLCIACSALCAACCALLRIDGLSIAPAATIETTAPAIAPVAMPETKGEIRIKDLPPFIKFIESVCPLVPQILHSKKMLVWHNRLFTIAGSYYIIYLTIRL